MTNELEKKFFDTFEIEPYDRYLDCTENLEVDCNRNCNCCDNVEDVYCYPEITDRILLELICIANREDVYIELVGTDVETMKNNLLENFIHFKRIIPKHQVRTLFEEGLE